MHVRAEVSEPRGLTRWGQDLETRFGPGAGTIKGYNVRDGSSKRLVTSIVFSYTLRRGVKTKTVHTRSRPKFLSLNRVFV